MTHETQQGRSYSVHFHFSCIDCGEKSERAGRCPRCPRGIVLPVPVLDIAQQPELDEDGG